MRYAFFKVPVQGKDEAVDERNRLRRTPAGGSFR